MSLTTEPPRAELLIGFGCIEEAAADGALAALPDVIHAAREILLLGEPVTAGPR